MKQKSQADKKMIATWLDHERAKKFAILAIQLEKQKQDLFAEAVDMLLDHYSRTSQTSAAA